MKKEIQVKIPFSFYHWSDCVSIPKMREDLDALEKLGATNININAYDDYGSATLEIEAYVMRDETDDEYNKRIKQEKIWAEQNKKRELDELKRLKEKYGI